MLRALFVLSLPVLFSTCDTPSGPRVRPGALAVYPQLPSYARMDIAGLTIDQVRITIIRPPSTVVKTITAPFSPDSTQIQLSIQVDVLGGQETLFAQIDLMSGSTVVFTGGDSVTVTAGQTTSQPEPVPVAFVGPGSQVAAITVAPRDTSVTLGAGGQFRVTAIDSSQQPVSQFYISWSTSGTDNSVDAAGLFKAASARGATWVVARTPTGIADSARVRLVPAPTGVALVSGDAQSGSVGQSLAQPLRVKVTAADAGPVSGVLVRFAGPTGAVLDSTNIVTDSNGFATTTGKLGSVAGSQTFTATVTGLPVVNFGMTASPGSASVLAFLTQPVATAAGVAIAPAITVAARDAFGNTIGTFNGTVTIALGANPGGAVLSGSLSADATAGVATFSDLSLTKASTGYTLVANSSGLTSATSSAFTITAGAAATLALVSGGGQNATPGTQLPQPVVVRVTDGYGNGVGGQEVVFAVVTGGGSVGTANATTDASGQASTTWTLGNVVGPQTITATAGSLAGSPLTVAANTSGAVSTTVSPKPVTLNALTQTIALSAQAKDAQGANVTGTFTWVSRAPAVATVSATGVVTAVTNGTTYVVANEAAGSKDSALVTVQQLIATINVTPGARSIYLTRSFTFTAAAVDGLGQPMGGTPTFTWTSTAPAVASVDAAGLVTGVGLGSAQIRATSGAVTGVANVSILTPITRIAVVVDSVGAAKTDTFTMASLGLTRRYRAIAHDTLDVVMSGITFTWVSTNGSVAVMNTTSGYDTASVTSAANGVTQVRATAQGFTSNPGAQLTVSQVLASIELLGPGGSTSASVGIGGNVTLTARGKDANNRYIAGGSFSFTSATPACGVVGATSGVVTGVANCPTDITATSGAITSNPLTVTVGGAVTPIISFGRDTVSVGRGSSASIPILLTTPVPVGGPSLTVNLTSSDTMAYWNPTSVTIPQGGTSANATLYGRNAGTVTVTATDGSGLGYAAASAVTKVTANMRLTSCSYAINATDIVSTQVLLSDPSPAGGTFVTFSYGTPGIAAISPDPAYIPAGQLAADIQIRGLAGGSTTITPVATGVNGTASSFTAYAPVVYAYTYSQRIGQGQYDPNDYVYLQASTNTALPVAFTSSDSAVATALAVTIPSGSNYSYFTTTAKAVGVATLTLTAPGWTGNNTIAVTVTSPRAGVLGGTSLTTTSPQRTVSLYAEDSTGTAHYRVNSLVVRVGSTDTSVMRVLDTVVTINAGQQSTSARVIPGGTPGTAWVVSSASGHQPDSTRFIVSGPKLNYYRPSALLGAGQYDNNQYVYAPNSVTTPLVVSLSSSNPTSVVVPSADTIPAGSNYTYFNVVGVALGTAQVISAATGYEGDTANYTVTTPVLTTSTTLNINNFVPPQAVTVYVADSTRSAHPRMSPLLVSVVSDNVGVVTVDSSTVTIDSGATSNSRARITVTGVGQAHIIFTAAGHRTVDTMTVNVTTPKLNFYISTARLGRRQHFDPNGNGFYVYTPNSRSTPVATTITQTNAAADSLTSTAPAIPANSNYVYLDAYGLATGVDTLIVSAAGYLPDTAIIIVTTPQLASSNLPSTTTTTNPPLSLNAYAEDSVGSIHYTTDPIVVAATSSDSNVIRPAQPYFRILANTNYTTTTVNVIGPGTASITFTDSAGTGYRPITTNTVTVTGPSLSFYNGTPVIGMRQVGTSGTNSSYVYVPNSVASPLVVNLVSTDPRVASVPVSVTIPANSNVAYFDVTGLDTVGTIQIQATATGYSPTSMNVQVTQPRFGMSTSSQLNTTSSSQPITIYAEDANGGIHMTTEPVVVTLQSSNAGVASLDSSSVTIPQGSYYVNTPRWAPGVIGTARLTASDQRAVQYKYNDGTFDVTVVTPTLNFNSQPGTLGIGQYQDNVYVYSPDNAAQSIAVALNHTGTVRTATFANLTTTPITGVTIAQGINYQYFRMAGTVRGTDTLVASATSPVFNPATIYTVVDSGRVDPISGWPTSIAAGDSVAITLYTRDINQGIHPVLATTTFNLSPNANIEFRSGGQVITSIDVPAGQQSVTFYVKGVSAGAGSADITQAGYRKYTNTVTVQ